MLRGEIRRRIDETCDASLERWYEANMKAINNTRPGMDERINEPVKEEADYIAEVLKARKELKKEAC